MSLPNSNRQLYELNGFSPPPRRALTQGRLRELLRYDPETGEFFRLKRNGKSKAGTIANHINKGTGYIVIGVEWRKQLAHRLAWLYMTGSWPSGVIDHINGNRADNRWSNLRDATQQQNCANSRISKNNKSGFKGVHKDQDSSRWHASLWFDGHNHYLGSFATPEDANAAYMEAATERFGGFARAG